MTTEAELRALLAEALPYLRRVNYTAMMEDSCNAHPSGLLDRITAALAEKDSGGWMPIKTAPKDNKRPLYFARIIDGELKELDFDGIWHSESESWEMPEVYYYWASANGIEDPTHWAYQDQPLPPLPTERKV